MAELVDAADLKSADAMHHAGSIPALGIIQRIHINMTFQKKSPDLISGKIIPSMRKKLLKCIPSRTKNEEGAEQPDVNNGGSDMVLLNPAAYRGYNGQEIRSDLRAEQAARINNPGPDNRVSETGSSNGSNPANLGSTASNDSLLESIEAIRAKLTAENLLLQERARKARENGNSTYDALERFREEKGPGALFDELG